MKIKILSAYSKILSFFLVLLGFASCDSIDPVDEYGTPYAKFKVKGIVVNGESEDNTPVKNIRVLLARGYMAEDEKDKTVHYIDSLQTDNNGYFHFTVEDFPTSQQFLIKFKDVDGDKNGTFETKHDVVKFENPEFKDGNGWYRGETTQDIGIVKIDPVKPEE